MRTDVDPTLLEPEERVAALLAALRRFWPLPPSEVDTLERSPLIIGLRRSAASADGWSDEFSEVLVSIEATARGMFAARLLPIPAPASPALRTVFNAYLRLRDCQAPTDIPDRARTWRDALTSFETAAIAAYGIEIGRLEQHAKALQEAGPASGMDPFVSAVAAIAPDSAIVKDFFAVRGLFERLVGEAARLRDAAPAGVEPIRRFAAIVKTTELARFLGQTLRGTESRALLGDFIPLHRPGNLLDDLNRAYYVARGARIYEDFATAASEGPLLATADALMFRRHLKTLGATPDDAPVVVLEIGVGDGSFAAGFLDFLDVGAPAGDGLRQRIRYHMADISAAMLDDTLANPRLAKHRDRLDVVPLDRLAEAQPGPALQRYHELLDDLPECAVLYVDREGGVWAAEVRGTFPVAEPARTRDGSAIETSDLLSRIRNANAEALRALREGELGRVDWEVRFVRCGPDDLPFGASLPSAIGEARDALILFNIGAARFLEACIERAPTGGLIRVFDYGIGVPLRGASGYIASAQVVRPYGGSWTRNLNFPFLREIAARRGAETRLLTQEDFLREAGLRAVHYRGLAGLGGRTVFSHACSGPEAPLPITALREHAAVAELAAGMGDDGLRYIDFVEALERRGLVSLGLPPWPAPHIEGLLPRLAADLDFSINAACRAAALPALREGRTWLHHPPELEALFMNLGALGFGAPAQSQQLWLLEVLKR